MKVLGCVHLSTIFSRMTTSTTMTIRIRSDVKDKLDRIAAETRRSKSFLAGEAVAAYVDRELKIVEGIRRSLDDMEAGRLIPHDEAMAEVQAVIEAIEAGRDPEA